MLVLDVSGSMLGAPIAALRVAAAKFCTDVMAADGTNYVAIVTYHDFASVLVPFTTNLQELLSAISTLTELSSTNTNAGLVAADTLLSAIPDGSNVIKNVVKMSDGMPNMGSANSSGPYTWTDYAGYLYANAAYHTAALMRNKGITIYSLGFFHDLWESELPFARRFMTDLAGSVSRYWEVVDPNDLEFIFGGIADDIVNPLDCWIQPRWRCGKYDRRSA